MSPELADQFWIVIHPWPILAALGLLLILSALLTLAQSAITAAPRGALKSLADRGVRGAKSALALQDGREAMAGGALLAQLILRGLMAALALSLAAPHIIADDPSLWALAAIAALSLVILAVAEVAPRILALAAPEAIARRAALVLWPLVAALSPLPALLARLFRAPQGTPLFTKADDIMGAITQGHSTGAVERENRDRLLGVLDLQGRTVDEIMRHRRQIEMIDSGQTPDEIIAQVLASPHSRLPIFKDDEENILGILHAKDLLREVDRLRRLNTGADIAATIEELDVVKVAMKPYFIPDTTSLDDQMRAFLARNAHLALVVDEYGSLQGLITLEDILEEIVGEINDEFDAVVRGGGIKPDAEGNYLIDGAMTIRDLNRAMDWHLPDDEANTIAGLVIHEAQMIPTEGQAFIFHGFRFQVVQRRENRVVKLKVRGV